MHPRKYVHLFLLISELILFVIMITIFSFGLSIYNKKEFVWIGSKILTINKILEDNMNNIYPLEEIISDTNITTSDRNYNYLLSHSTRTQCEQNYKKCGILDTYGNIMCIPEREFCPINKVIVALESEKNYYKSNGYKFAKLLELPENYLLYYTNNSVNDEIVVHLKFSDEQPRYISPENFIFDNETYDKYLATHYSGGGDSDGDYGYDGGGGDYDGGGGGDYGGGGDDGIGDGGGYWRNLDQDKLYGNMKATNYINKKFEEKKNIDSNFKYIDKNLYVKNYIGFKSNEQMNFFMTTNLLPLYLRMNPNFASTIISIFCAVALLILSIFSICRLNYKDKPNDHGDKCCIFMSKCIVGSINFIIFIGYYIYFIYAYCKIFKNPDFLYIKKIKADNFIEDFINELSRGKNKAFTIIIIFLMSISFIFFIMTWIFKPLHQIYLKSSNREITNTNYNIKANNKIPKDLECSDTKINKIKDFENISPKLDEKNNNIKDFEKNDIKKINNNKNINEDASKDDETIIK